MIASNTANPICVITILELNSKQLIRWMLCNWGGSNRLQCGLHLLSYMFLIL